MPPFAKTIGTVSLYDDGEYAGNVRVERQPSGAVAIWATRLGAGTGIGAIWPAEEARKIAALIAEAAGRRAMEDTADDA